MIEQETERLLLRQWRAEDFDAYARYYANEETAKFVGGVKDRDQAWRRLASEIGHWALKGYGYWAVEEKEAGTFVGCVGLWFSEGWPELELGYWIMPNLQGKGYATEAGVKARDYAWAVVGAKSLVSYIDSENEASKRVAVRLGARFDKTIGLLSHGQHDVYRYPEPRQAHAT